ncbi:vacuolar protein sorting 23B [Guillardia theta CCMP2712]|uniref:Vacuolar protein sorting 23B n=1 Tax=Guillardia theta (strain CCMP2712) TaxID=905079 RepID=L1IJT2_GUITC|nr:vacuolar protein sorting 23B [Guillardia theta CCMP2712]EKX36496.1 vacuolar protein sorting 23B [Guillardia theta CCMP2712]|eukprot:XP_005823476.1 vacuolar protein sorting 23B [Guillardia theta CCMP2712]
MFYNQKKYNCPVRIWFCLDYPKSPPICYVTPTRDMGIKPRHVHVDSAGFIYHQYLTQWSDSSSVKELVATLKNVFSREPPVYAKSSSSAGARLTSSTSNGSQAQPPVRPIPPNPVANPPMEHLVASQPNERVHDDSYFGPMPRHSSMPPVVSSEPSRPHPEEQAAVNRQSTEEESRLTFVAMTFSKIEDKYDRFRRENDSEFDAYQLKQKDMDITFQKLHDYKIRLTQERDRLFKMLEELDAAEQTIERVQEDLQSSSQEPVENTLKCHDTMADQLLQAVCHDKAIEDTLYELDKALDDSKIETHTYLKIVHKLSREQFFQKELINKILARRKQLGVY